MRCGTQLLVFDAGSGIRELGAAYSAPLNGAIFFSHYHYDHVQGLPFFTPLFDSRNRFAVYGPTRGGQTVQQILSGHMRQPYFPVTAELAFKAKLEFWPIAEGQRVDLGGVTVTPVELNHPGGSLGYRVDFEGKSVVYATDIEHGTEADERLAALAHGADLLIYDAMYTADEYEGRAGPPKTGWGHSTWQGAVEAANRAGVKMLALFHHDPTRTDADLARLLRVVRKVRPRTVLARERQPISL